MPHQTQIKLAGLVFTLIAGTLAHFIYQWSGEKPVVGLITPVNESTWEHLKLLFFPMLVSGTVEYFFLRRQYPNYVFAQAVGILVGMLTVVVLFYTYSGVLGFNFLAADILTFVIGVLAGFGVSLRLLKSGSFSEPVYTAAGCLMIGALLLLFLVFTKAPPHIGLFRDPVTGEYGMSPAQ